MYATHPDEVITDLSAMQRRDARGRLEGDEQLVVRFYKKAERSSLKSEEQGRPVYDDLDYILILVPGEATIKIDTIATSEHKERFPLEWKQFQEQGIVAETGTPLEAWGALAPSLVAEFKHFNIRTVEALANMSDSNAQKFVGGAHILRDKAKHWLKANADAAIVEKQAAEMAKRDTEIAELRKMVEDMAAKPKKA